MNQESRLRAHEGRAFEDILDGYFPLRESIRQMMDRQGFSRVWVTLQHAPIMNLKHLAPTDPVPLTLPKVYAGMIDFMSLTATQADATPALSGVGEWFWVDPSDRTALFPTSVRLGEPAFVRGIGIHADDLKTAGTRRDVAILHASASADLGAQVAQATGELGWTSCRAWGLGTEVSGVAQTKDIELSRALFGQGFDASTSPTIQRDTSSPTYVLLNTSSAHLNAEELEIALRV